MAVRRRPLSHLHGSISSLLLAKALVAALTYVCLCPSQVAIFVNGAPYYLLKSKASKCVKLEAPRNTTLRIAYHAPDLQMDEAAKARRLEQTEQDIRESSKFFKDHLDPSGEPKKDPDGNPLPQNDLFKQRMEQMKKTALQDINIAITQRAVDMNLYPGAAATAAGGRGQGALPRPNKQTEVLEQREGSFEFKTAEEFASLIDVCMQSYTASPTTPSRVSINITIVIPEEQLAELTKKDDKDNASKDEAADFLDERGVQLQTSRIAGELVRMTRRAEQISINAEEAKSYESTFHERSLSLNRAVRFWPLVRLSVLIVGGFMQVNHVVQFMKRKHLY